MLPADTQRHASWVRRHHQRLFVLPHLPARTFLLATSYPDHSRQLSCGVLANSPVVVVILLQVKSTHDFLSVAAPNKSTDKHDKQKADVDEQCLVLIHFSGPSFSQT